jgi:hypothetical protein
MLSSSSIFSKLLVLLTVFSGLVSAPSCLASVETRASENEIASSAGDASHLAERGDSQSAQAELDSGVRHIASYRALIAQGFSAQNIEHLGQLALNGGRSALVRAGLTPVFAEKMAREFAALKALRDVTAQAILAAQQEREVRP